MSLQFFYYSLACRIPLRPNVPRKQTDVRLGSTIPGRLLPPAAIKQALLLICTSENWWPWCKFVYWSGPHNLIPIAHDPLSGQVLPITQIYGCGYPTVANVSTTLKANCQESAHRQIAVSDAATIVYCEHHLSFPPDNRGYQYTGDFHQLVSQTQTKGAKRRVLISHWLTSFGYIIQRTPH